MKTPASGVPRRVLVTGGAGFLGSHLCADNFYTGLRTNIAHPQRYPNFELLRHDSTFPLYVEVDEIYKRACPPRPGIISTIRCRR